MKRLAWTKTWLLAPLVLGILLWGELGTPQGSAQFSSVTLQKERLFPQERKIAALLRSTCQQLMQQGVTPGNAAALHTAQRFSSFLVKVDQYARIQVYIELSTVTAPLLPILHLLGEYDVEIELVNEERQIVQAWMPFGQLEALADADFVHHIRPPDYAIPQQGSVTTEGDTILRTAAARSAFDVDGTGARVGVISDGVNDRAAAQATGDLPNTVSVFGSCNPALTQSSCNEGTAMLEIVHDLAPGATLGFCGVATSLEMVACVRTLSDSFAADIIVDDLGFPGEPYFEDGLVAQAVSSAVAGGIVYISAAGNSAQQHYEADYVAGAMELPLPPAGPVNVTVHDFGLAAGGASDTTLDILLFPSGSMTVILQWNDPFGGSDNDYDLLLLDNPEETILRRSEFTQNGNAAPLEVFIYENPTGGFLLVKLVVRQFSGADRRLEMFVKGEAIFEPAYQIPEGSVFGHQAVSGVLATAAIDAQDPGNDTIRNFSSQGPATIFFPAFAQRQKPDLSAIDNVSVTGVGGFGSPFSGTSAAAPHVAGVAALLLSAQPDLSAEQVRLALTTTAIDIALPGVDGVSGAGLVEAQAALLFVRDEMPIGVLENPPEAGFGSGIGVISGFLCDARQIEIEFDGTAAFEAAYGTSRGDTQEVCGDTNNGFSLLFNWNLLGEGSHTVRALADGVEFARATITVTTLGLGEFPMGLSGDFSVSDFPLADQTTNLRWQQSLQNFVIFNGAGEGGGHSGAAPRTLENPPPGSFQSGIGVISGFVCDASQITIEFNATETFEAAYGTSRDDTQEVCGDTNNGFSLLFNWNLLGEGSHTVRALADGVEFARATITVTTLGLGEFPMGLSGTFPLSDFPQAGQTTSVQWQESLQNFVIVGRS